MPTGNVTRLYPPPAADLPLHGIYLAHDLRALPDSQPFVYTNYITSLDGRIAIPHPARPGLTVPPQTANPRDWRLFQELASQADILITSGRYLRDYGAGRAQEILDNSSNPEIADLHTWRTARGLPPQPDLAVISASLDFPVPPALTAGGRRVIVFTTTAADPARAADLSKVATVIPVGAASVDGRELVEALHALGYRLICNATGPRVLHLLLAAGKLDRLYLTQANRLLGGSPFSSIVEGGLLAPSVDFRLNEIYLDPHAPGGPEQLFVSYNLAGALQGA